MHGSALPLLPLVSLALGLALAGAGCTRPQLPALALRARYTHRATERSAGQTLALSLGCRFALERGAGGAAVGALGPPRADDDTLAPGTRAGVTAGRCADPSLCAWQRDAQAEAERTLLPLAEEERP